MSVRRGGQVDRPTAQHKSQHRTSVFILQVPQLQFLTPLPSLRLNPTPQLRSLKLEHSSVLYLLHGLTFFRFHNPVSAASFCPFSLCFTRPRFSIFFYLSRFSFDLQGWSPEKYLGWPGGGSALDTIHTPLV